MTAQAYSRDGGRKSRSLRLTLALFAIAIAAAAIFVSYILWPTWPEKPVPLDAPSIPVTVAGVLFDVPPAAVRVPMQRRPGAHERIDLMFLWPSLTPPHGDDDIAKPVVTGDNEVLPVPTSDKRLFVSIAPLGSLLSPDARLRTIYPRYISRRPPPAPTGLPSCRFGPARRMRAKIWSISLKNPSSSLPGARVPSAPCRAHASTSVRSARPRSRCNSRANG